MMKLIKVNPQRGKRVLAERHVSCSVSWSHANKQYEGVVIIENTLTGEKFRLVGDQIEWETVIAHLHSMFAEGIGS